MLVTATRMLAVRPLHAAVAVDVSRTEVPPGPAGMVDAAPDCSNVGVPNVANQSLAWLKSSVKARDRTRSRRALTAVRSSPASTPLLPP
ncbi:hypothetical protein D3C76_1715360 [compost metagenome]